MGDQEFDFEHVELEKSWCYKREQRALPGQSIQWAREDGLDGAWCKVEDVTADAGRAGHVVVGF